LPTVSVRIAIFLLLLATVWAGTTHYAARLLLDTDTRFRAYADPRVWTYLGSFETWVPRLLGLAPFAVVLIASERSIFNLPHIDDDGVTSAITYWLRIFDLLVVAVATAFLFYTVKRRDLMATDLIQRTEAKLSIVNRLLQPLGLGGTGRRKAKGASSTGPALGPLLLIIVFVVSALIIFVGAARAAAWLPRALIVPIILGGWLPLLTFLSGLGRQFRAPLIVAAALVIALFSAVLGDNHSSGASTQMRYSKNTRTYHRSSSTGPLTSGCRKMTARADQAHVQDRSSLSPRAGRAAPDFSRRASSAICSTRLRRQGGALDASKISQPHLRNLRRVRKRSCRRDERRSVRARGH
jgi:hypothetical protein